VADVQTIIEQNGPLPIKVAPNIQSDAPAMVMVAGSVWSSSPASMVGVELFIDGNLEAKAQIFANQASTHLAVVPFTFSYTFTIGQHTFELDKLTGPTMADQNDFFQVTLLY
jgi:hypothetical protein